VVSAVAAGNGGEVGYSTVESPGGARRAISVGATDKSDVLAPFSSKGPARSTDAIKPDLVAPGVAVNSTLPEGSYARFSGTSMAAPHVAGAAALLRQREPALTPDAVKSLLMTSARDLGLDPFAQGTGRLDVLAAVQARTIVVPASLSLGYDDPRQPTFDRSLSVTVTNTGDAAREYTIGVAPGLPAGITAAVAPASLTLEAGQSGSFTFSLHVDNARVPNPAEPPFSYHSHLRVESGGTTIRVPFAFIKAPVLTVTFDQAPSAVAVVGRGGASWYPRPGLSLNARLPQGEYDVLAVYVNWDEDAAHVRTILRESVVVADGATVAISRGDAAHALTVDPRNEQGEAVIPDAFDCQFTRRGDGLSLGVGVLALDGAPIEWRTSAMSERFVLGGLVSGINDNRAYTLHWSRRGVDGPVVFRNDPEELRHLTFRADVEPGLEEVVMVNSTVHVDRLGAGGAGIGGLLRAPFEMHRYVLVPGVDAYYTHIQQSVRGRLITGLPVHKTPLLQVGSETVRFYPEPKRNQVLDPGPGPLFETRAASFVVGMEPYSWFGRFVNHPDQIRIGSSFGGATWPFVGQMMDYRPLALVPFELYLGGTLVREGTFQNAQSPTDGHPMLLGVTPGRYTLRLHGPKDVIADQPGSVVVEATFHTAAADPNPPYLSHFNLLLDGQPTKALDLSGRSEIRFRAYDDTRLAHVALQFRAVANGPWLPLFLRRQGHEYSARLPYLPLPVGPGMPPRPPTPVSLRLLARDGAGNLLSLEMQPAFTLSLPPLHGMLSEVAARP
jgi:hypothetical protein